MNSPNKESLLHLSKFSNFLVWYYPSLLSFFLSLVGHTDSGTDKAVTEKQLFNKISPRDTERHRGRRLRVNILVMKMKWLSINIVIICILDVS